MPFPYNNTMPAKALHLLNRIELPLIAAMAILLPFDHWFFGHLVNPAPMRVLGFVLTGVWLLQCVTRQIQLKFEIWHLFVVLFLATCFYSAIESPVILNPAIDNYRYKIVAAAKIVTAMLFMALACQAMNQQKIILFLRIHLMVGVTICALSLVMYALHITKIWPHGFMLWVEPDIYAFVRIQGVSYEPHRFGAYAMTLIPWLLIPELRRHCGWSSEFALAALATVLLCLMLSFAVGTFIALPVLLLLLACYSQKNLSVMLRTGLILTILFALVVSIPTVYQSLLEIIEVKIRSQSLSDRLYHWAIAIIEIRMHPWTGVGPEGYSYYLAQLEPKLAHATPASNPPQNMLLGIMANTGVPGIISFILFLMAFLQNYISRYRNSENNKLISYASLAIALSHFIYQQSIWLPWALNQWLFMAFAWAALTPANNAKKAAP
jgi:O-antigen ligase